MSTQHIDVASGTKWSRGKCLGDSPQLRVLRESLEDSAHRFANCHKTPLRLGIYAGETGQIVTDYGRHSARWIALFTEGFEAARKR